MNTTEINTLQQRTIQLLLSGSTVAAAARELGIDRTTIYAWHKSNPAFTIHLDRARSIQAQITADSLQDLASTAINTIHEILVCQATPPAIRLRAAQAVLKDCRQPTAAETSEPPQEIPHISTEIDTFDEETNVAHIHIRRESSKTGRNEPCPCNSGLKFKRCCGNPLRQPVHVAEAA